MKKAKLSINNLRGCLKGSITSPKDDGPMVYLMRRDIRAHDNWSLLQCQDDSKPVRVAHVLETKHPSYRLAWFYAKGLEECQSDLEKLKIPLDILTDHGELRDYLSSVSAAGVVADLNTLRDYDLAPVVSICDDVKIPCWEVDSHNIIPVWVASDKQEYAARTIRSKINKILGDWLVDIPVTASNRTDLKTYGEKFHSDNYLKKYFDDTETPTSIKFTPGGKAGKEALNKFISKISKFDKYRNDPTQNALSNLSPWFRFGHLSKQRVAYEVKHNTSSHAGFLEELIIRGELAENYTYYNKKYDNIQGGPAFGIKTLKDHANDERPHVYQHQQFADAKTHDELWNAAQRQLVNDGKMHGFMRMYWAKKILEWTESPEKALEIAICLNDTFSMDGRDPRGYVGIMWSITGLHDQGWRERDIFGKVRYMNYEGCKRKFDIDAYIQRHPKKQAKV